MSVIPTRLAASRRRGSTTDVAVDHIVFYAGYELEALAGFLERIGFQLTPLGRHSSGSINRLAMLEGQYIELMAFAEGTPRTVRPVDTPHAQGVASFTITTVREPAPDARTFMCRHHTPELVWQPAWQLHANGATRVSEVRLPTRDPHKLHAAVRTIFDIPGGLDAAAYDAAGTRVRVVARRRLTPAPAAPGATPSPPGKPSRCAAPSPRRNRGTSPAATSATRPAPRRWARRWRTGPGNSRSA